MCRVIHTTTFELYTRTWCVHEVDECLLAKLEVKGLFDMYAWAPEMFGDALTLDTSTSHCRPEDKEYLFPLIIDRGGFARLDENIKSFRRIMLQQLRDFLKRTEEHDFAHCDRKCVLDEECRQGDWESRESADMEGNGYHWVEWDFHKQWTDAMSNVIAQGHFSMEAVNAQHCINAYPLGKRSMPFGPARDDQF